MLTEQISFSQPSPTNVSSPVNLLLVHSLAASKAKLGLYSLPGLDEVDKVSLYHSNASTIGSTRQNNDPNHLIPVPELLAFAHDTDVQWYDTSPQLPTSVSLILNI